jgi:hypothetical protein
MWLWTLIYSTVQGENIQKARSTKSEIRNKSKIRIPNVQNKGSTKGLSRRKSMNDRLIFVCFGHSNFEFRHSDLSYENFHQFPQGG